MSKIDKMTDEDVITLAFAALDALDAMRENGRIIFRALTQRQIEVAEVLTKLGTLVRVGADTWELRK